MALRNIVKKGDDVLTKNVPPGRKIRREALYAA